MLAQFLVIWWLRFHDQMWKPFSLDGFQENLVETIALRRFPYVFVKSNSDTSETVHD